MKQPLSATVSVLFTHEDFMSLQTKQHFWNFLADFELEKNISTWLSLTGSGLATPILTVPWCIEFQHFVFIYKIDPKEDNLHWPGEKGQYLEKIFGIYDFLIWKKHARE